MFNLSIHNYRSFQNQKLNFSKINILIGENSGGKSSVLKLLLALKQTIDSPTESNLKLSGDFADLGNYEEVVYYRKKTRKISIGFESNDKYLDFFLEFIHENIVEGKGRNKSQLIKKLFGNLNGSITNINFDFSSKLDDHSTIKTIIKNSILGSIEIIQNKEKQDNPYRQLLCDIKYNLEGEIGIIENCLAFKDGFLTLFDSTLEDKCKKKFKEKSDDFFYKIVFLLVFQNYIKNEIEGVRFVNPIGSSPKRFYFQEDKKATYKLINIEKFINLLSDKTLSEKNYKERIALLNNVIKDFGIAEEIEVIKDKLLPVLALNVKTKDFWSNITDVGYGVSLQIPILFQAILSENYTDNGETILIEQPEVHLHPSLQAKFIETLLAIGNKNTYFIETHSEHIIRKLQVLIKSKAFNLKPEDVTIHYFKREPLKFKISEHKILPSGKLDTPFPDGFYDTSYSLVKQLL